MKISLFMALVLGFATQSFATNANLPIEGADLLSTKKIEVTAKDKKGVVVVFLSALCPCSNSHIPELTSLAKAYPDFSFVGVHANSDEAVDRAKTYFTQNALPFPVIQDEKSKLADQFKALKTPHAFVLMPTGEIVYQGGVSNSADFTHATKRFLRDALEDIEGQKTVRTSQGRTLGCVIKRG